MKRIIAIAMIAALVSCSKSNDNNNVNPTDMDFTKKATMGNTAEIDAGQTASTKGTSTDIKNFGQMMVNDHGTARNDLHVIAKDLKLSAPDSLDAQNVALAAQLATLSGRSFDSVYIHSQVAAHVQTISLFQDEIKNGMNNRLKTYANNQMPHLQTHLQNAQSIAAGF
jgi:putative membrane protein